MKRPIEDYAHVIEDAKVILLDIEGTTTSINFVKEELFPYVRREVKTYLQETWEKPETKDDVEALKNQIEEESSAGLPGIEPCPSEDVQREEMISAVVFGVLAMMDADRKVKPLKTLQGHMWRRAYREGILKGHVYDDVLGALEKWTKDGKQIGIYSSGSVEAQKLLFGYSCFGDLLKYFSHHFDTGVGYKMEAASYREILRVLDCESQNVLFVTDVAKEAWAAEEAGIHTILSVRDGTAPLSEKDMETFPQITSFAQLLETPCSSSKKRRTSKNVDSVVGNDAAESEKKKV